MRSLTIRMATLLLALLLNAQGPDAAAQSGQGIPVDLELALLVDVSASVNDAEFRLQTDGLAAALTDRNVLAAIRRFARHGLAVCIIQWSNHKTQRLAVSWRRIGGRADALKFASAIKSMPRLGSRGHTALGDALLFGLGELDSNQFSGKRRVIDLSGDGRANDGSPLRLARQKVIDKGVTINGLAILNELPLLDQYYRRYLIGGKDAFVIAAQDYNDFTRAMTAKLLREISSLPLALNAPPTREIKNAQLKKEM